MMKSLSTRASTRRFLAAGLLLTAVGCGSSRPEAVPEVSGSPSSAAPASGDGTSRSPTLSSAAVPLRSAPPAGTATAAPAEPDFSGTGCYPDIPTPFTVTVTPDGKSFAAGDAIPLIVTVHATTASRVEHANAQEFDFALEVQGQEVWRWSSVAPLITPTHYDREYAAGETRTFTATWDGRYARSQREAVAGNYTLHGYFIGNMKSPPPQGRFICFDDAHLVLR
ncbi:MAG: BsuPI-related putative proteinase inhibitor [Actinomycetota bacterium]|nr:hypothetical protein [Actinomycetota bacterium]